MKVTIQSTGWPPEEFEAVSEPRVSTQMLPGDKRGVRLSLYREAVGFSKRNPPIALFKEWAVLTYLTEWGIERPFTRIFKDDCDGDWDTHVRAAAKTILPPGAGYPAMPQYESRQLKLLGMLETLTLVALSEVLAEQIE